MSSKRLDVIRYDLSPERLIEIVADHFQELLGEHPNLSVFTNTQGSIKSKEMQFVRIEFFGAEDPI